MFYTLGLNQRSTGSYHYLIADHGSLLVAVERAEDGSIAQTNKVKLGTHDVEVVFKALSKIVGSYDICAW